MEKVNLKTDVLMNVRKLAKDNAIFRLSLQQAVGGCSETTFRRYLATNSDVLTKYGVLLIISRFMNKKVDELINEGNEA